VVTDAVFGTILSSSPLSGAAMTDQLKAACAISIIAVVATFSSVVFGQTNISVSSPGPSWDAGLPPPAGTVVPDWLTDVDPLLVVQSKTTLSFITIDPRGFPPVPDYNGKLNLSISCCGILDAPGQAAPVRARLGTDPNRIDLFPFVNIAGMPAQVRFTLTAGSAGFGNFTARIRAHDETQHIDKSRDVLFTLLPPWPGDGPDPICTKNLKVLKLSQITPDPYTAKMGIASKLTSLGFGLLVGSNDTQIERPRGLNLTVHKPPSPLPPTSALVTFKHNKGWHTGIRNDNSANCTTSGKTMVVEPGTTVGPFLISVSDTSTLVFSKPVCRFTFFWCWSVGLEDVMQFSEGPFWTFFGGRQVDIETVGDWGDIPVGLRGEADLVIQTQ
jgi:hypothetical protein